MDYMDVDLLAGWKQAAVRAKPSTTTYDWGLIYFLAHMMKARTTVEIGIGWGYGVLVMGLYAKDVGGWHTAIDIGGAPVMRARKLIEEFDLRADVIPADSSHVTWVGGAIDILFVDGNHSKNGVLGDIRNWCGHVRRNGLIYFHDYYNAHTGVRDAVDMSYNQEEYEMITFPYTSAGGALWRKR